MESDPIEMKPQLVIPIIESTEDLWGEGEFEELLRDASETSRRIKASFDFYRVQDGD